MLFSGVGEVCRPAGGIDHERPARLDEFFELRDLLVVPLEPAGASQVGDFEVGELVLGKLDRLDLDAGLSFVGMIASSRDQPAGSGLGLSPS